MSVVAATGSENCLTIGTRLADFEITGVLGEGGFGIVYLAFDHSLQRTVAIKEYMPGVLAARGADHSVSVRAERHQDTFNVGLKSFINEARFLAQFDHKSLVKVYRYWEQNRTAYTAMQYYEGRTIKDIVARSPELVTQEWCMAILRQILGALEMLYTMNIVHRDVSPDNIIVQDNGDAVLLDFGSARQIIGESTRGLTVILKPGYAPVEQYAGDASLEQGPYTDIYALAAVMYFAIVGEAPATSIARMVKDPMVPLRERTLPGYSVAFRAALDDALAVLAAQRPQTIDAFRALLGIEAGALPPARPSGVTQRFATVERLPETVQVLHATSSEVAALAATPLVAIDGAEPPAPAAPPSRHRGKIIAGAALLLCGVIGGSAYALLGDPGDTIRVAPSQQFGPAASAQQVAPPAETPAPVAADGLPSSAAPAVPAVPSAPAAPAAPIVTAVTAAPESSPIASAAEPVPEVAKPRPAVPATATYKLALKPWGTVYVDGKQRGVSPPLKKLQLAEGKHTVKVVNPSFPDHVIELDVKAGQAGAIEHDFAAPPR